MKSTLLILMLFIAPFLWSQKNFEMDSLEYTALVDSAYFTKANFKSQVEVYKVIRTFFEGMRDADTNQLKSTLHPNTSLFTSYVNQENRQSVYHESLQEFIDAVGSPHDDTWNEYVSMFRIQIRDGLATAWMDYRFYISDEFSHCGVNTMNLALDGERWIIVQITDTRTRTGCDK